MNQYQVIRTHFSPYHGPTFESDEKERIETLGGLNYVRLSEANPSLPSILITNTHSRLQGLSRELCQNTHLILHANSGYEHFALEAELWQKIPVIVGHGIRAQAVSEYYLSCLFNCLIPVPQHEVWDKKREWNRPLIQDKKIWIYGFGHIGKKISQTLKSLGAEVTVIDPYKNKSPSSKKKLSQAEVVLVCCGLNKSSRFFFNQHFFEHSHDELIFINAARGELVDEKALKKFLILHPKAQAFLDVFENEPFKQDWEDFPQVKKTSHIAGVFKDLDKKILDFEAVVLKNFMTMPKRQFLKKYQDQLLQNKWISGDLI